MQVADLTPEGKELFKHHLDHGTALMTDEGEPCNSAQVVKMLTGDDLVPDATDTPDKTPSKPSTKQIARERFIAMLGKTLQHVGFSDSLSGRVVLAVGSQPTRIKTDFAYNPATGMGVVWGWTNGGAVRFPIPLDSVEMGTLISLKDAESYRLNGAAGQLKTGARGYWIAAYRLEQPQTTLDTAEVETTTVSDPEPKRGQLPNVTYYDEAPFFPGVGEKERTLGQEFVANLDEKAQAKSE